MILFTYCDKHTAAQLTKRIRLAVASINTSDLHPGLQLTASIGFTEFRPNEAIDAALKRVDDALYQAKDSGRNCVVGSA